MAKAGSMRMGTTSLFALIIIICVAIMSVLSLATANSQLALAHKHSDSIETGFLNEYAAQHFMQYLDEMLLTYRETGQVDPDFMHLAPFAGQLEEVVERTNEATALYAPDDSIVCTAELDGYNVLANFVANDKITLDIRILINTDATYTISAWKSGVEWQEGAEETLWTP